MSGTRPPSSERQASRSAEALAQAVLSDRRDEARRLALDIERQAKERAAKAASFRKPGGITAWRAP